MIAKLRRKFILINMSIVTLILLAVLSAVLLSSQNSMERTTQQFLQRMVEQKLAVGGFGGAAPPPLPQGERLQMPYLLLTLDSQGAVVEAQGSYYYLEDSELIEQLAGLVLARQERSGALDEQELHYLRADSANGAYIAFADTSMQRQTLDSLLLSMLLAAGAAWALFLLLAVLLARWAVLPVERSWRQQRRFVADASHELKTPLTVILANSEMMNGEPLDERQRRRLDNIKAEAMRMKKLVEDMLCLARSDLPEQQTRYEELDLSDLLTNCLLIYEPLFYESGLSLDYQIAEQARIRGDAAQLRQLADILLDNARKYTPRGGAVELRLEKAGRDKLRLTVRNSGEPLDKQQLEHIFERFYRGDASRHSEGYGLGLSIARGIAERHHGGIRAESSAERGNLFIVTLPASV